MTQRDRLDAWRDRRTTPLAFTLDGVRYEVPEHPARVWVLALLSDEPSDLLLDLLPEDLAQELWDEATDPDSDLDPGLLYRIGKGLLTVAAGRPWWQATQLLTTMVADWDSYIALARDRGLGDPLDWPVDELCAWGYLRMIRHASKEDRARIDAALARPPADVTDDDVDTDGDVDGWDESSGFFSLAAQHGIATGGT